MLFFKFNLLNWILVWSIFNFPPNNSHFAHKKSSNSKRTLIRTRFQPRMQFIILLADETGPLPRGHSKGPKKSSQNQKRKMHQPRPARSLMMSSSLIAALSILLEFGEGQNMYYTTSPANSCGLLWFSVQIPPLRCVEVSGYWGSFPKNKIKFERKKKQNKKPPRQNCSPFS